MNIQLKRGDIAEVKAGVLLVGHLQTDEGELGGAIQSLDAVLGGEIAQAIKSGEFRGEFKSTLSVRSHGRIPATHVVVLGLGAPADLTIERVRQAVGYGVKLAKQHKATSIASVLLGAGMGGLNPEQVAQALVEGVLLTDYQFDAWKNKPENHAEKLLTSAELIEIDAGKTKIARAGLLRGLVYAKAAMHTRHLVNESPSEMSPAALKKDAQQLAKQSERITLKVLDREGARKLGMRAFLAVAAGSQTEPYFLHLTYKPKKAATSSLVLIGKGITFDSGGLSLKPADGMMTMKCDMAGAATVLGVFSALEALAPDIEVHGLIAACENMPSGSAYRPGDVVRAMNGTTIEVLNTDAEGRVTLADALSYAATIKPDAIIDIATLTGACVMALGEEIAGVMTDSDALATAMLEAADTTGEEFWELPLFPGYEVLVESKIADVQNIGVVRWGGALTAGLFLKKFVDPKTPWMHLDIAGPAFAEREYLSYVPYGGTGMSVRTLLQLIQNYRA